MGASQGKPTRQYDLDWIRVIGIFGVFLFHNSMFYNDWYWHVGNSVIYSGMDGFSDFLDVWIMPLFFVISGVSTYYALGVRSAGAFVKERMVRLIVPLLFGVFLLSPPQVYLENITHHQYTDTFWQWLPHYFDGWYGITPNGNFAWMGLHLWYLLILFLFSVLTLPLFFRLRLPRLRAFTDRLGRDALQPWGWVLCVILLAALDVFLNPSGAGSGAGGWPFLVYLLYYIYGYMLFSNPNGKAAIRQYGPVAIVFALLTVAAYIFWTQSHGYAMFGTGTFLWLGTLRTVSTWCFLLSFFYLGDRYLNRNSQVLQYCSRAVMPFYILHQPVIVFFGYWVRDVALPVGVKYPLQALTEFIIIMAIYHFVVRPSNGLLFLFGMKPSKKSGQSKGITA